MLTINHKEHMFELKYRPGTLSECILPAADRENLQAVVDRANKAGGKLPHLILQSNKPGTGKTTVACALGKDTNCETLFVNGSGCGIDFIKNDLTAFAQTKSLDGRHKLLILDEFDRPQLAEAQRYLRSFLEAYGKNCSVIITANNLDGIIGPLQSRATVIKFGQATDADATNMMKEMFHRSEEICANEHIEVQDRKVLLALIKKNFPDFRKVVNQLDHYSAKGVIDSGILDIVMTNTSSIEDVVNAVRNRDIPAIKMLAPKYAPDYANFVVKLLDHLYPMIQQPAYKAMLIEIAGENNQFHGIAGNVELHTLLLLKRLAVELKFD